ncbi:MAG TPA: rhomboid family intramembrane serine protease [Candidatus Woesebacteria bacterium]|nr:rhomboid family intramembrane serine protease [Candidatus Woesebacteria bacterium]
MFLEILSGFLISVYIVSNNISPLIYCQPNFFNSISRTFLHANLAHLTGNVVSLQQIGSILILSYGNTLFAKVTILITVLEIFTDYFLTRYFQINCSIGYSGVIFGLLTYLLITTRVPLNQLGIILAFQLLPGFLSPGISNFGHMLGILNGVIASYLLPV